MGWAGGVMVGRELALLFGGWGLDVFVGDDGDVGGDVFHLVFGEVAGDLVHFGAVFVFFVGAADAFGEFFELGEDVPVLEAGEGRGAEDHFAAGVVAVAAHADFGEGEFAVVEVAFESGAGGGDGEGLDVGGDGFDLSGIEGVGDGAHLDPGGVLGIGPADVVLKFSELAGDIPGGHGADGGGFEVDFAFALGAVAGGADFGEELLALGAGGLGGGGFGGLEAGEEDEGERGGGEGGDGGKEGGHGFMMGGEAGRIEFFFVG
jgi:hypothetical protein